MKIKKEKLDYGEQLMKVAEAVTEQGFSVAIIVAIDKSGDLQITASSSCAEWTDVSKALFRHIAGALEQVIVKAGGFAIGDYKEVPHIH
jgi:imidazole glycerol phosphate synthase subunit HisF